MRNYFVLLKKLLQNNLFKCPRCNNPLLDEEDCSNCGQPIDYS